jgi:hypothetical protein
MGVLYPLAIVNTASITSLVRMTLYHRSIGVFPARVETSEDTAAENLVARPPSGIPGGESTRNQMVVEEAGSK